MNVDALALRALLQKILERTADREELVWEFQTRVWDSETELPEPLRTLAYDLEFCEPHGPRELETEIREALAKLDASGHS